MKMWRRKGLTRNVKRAVFTGLLLTLFIALGGCANTIVPDQVQAIETAIAQMAEQTEEFYYFEYDDLTPQVEAALEGQEKRQEEYQYTIDVYRTDVGKIPEDRLAVPEIAYTIDTDSMTYWAQYSMALTDIIEDYIITAEPEDLVPVQLTVKLTLVEKAWQAELLQADITSLCNTYDTEITDKADNMAYATEGYETLQFVEDIRTEIHGAASGTLYEGLWELDSVDRDGDQYTVSVSYPDFTEQLNQASDQGYTYYADQGKRFTTLDAGTVETKLLELLADKKAEAPKQSVTLELTDATAVSEEIGKVLETFNTLCTEKVTALTEKANQELVQKAQEKPASGVLSGNNSGQLITVKTSADLYDLHITFYALSGTDLSEEGTKSLSAYIRAGDTVSVYLPVGNYKLVQGYGDSWYGDELAFGPSGTYTVSDILITIEYGYEYTLTLYGVEGGNLPTSKIPFPYSA